MTITADYRIFHEPALKLFLIKILIDFISKCKIYLFIIKLLAPAHKLKIKSNS